MPLYLTEQEVDRCIDMSATLDVVELSLEHQSDGGALNNPRQRLTAAPDTHVNTMMAADSTLGIFGFKTYTLAGGIYRFFVFLSDSHSGELLAIVEANRLGQLRTGAATGIATKHLARGSADTVGIIGSGYQARTQLEAVCAVRGIRQARVYSRSPERRSVFAAEMSESLSIEAVSVQSARRAVDGADIVITITNSRTPVLEGAWLEAGMHIDAVGGADAYVTELDEAAITRADTIIVDDREQAKIESGELMMSAARGTLIWERTIELWQIVSGQTHGRRRPQDITLFKSLGMALWDISAAKAAYDRAVELGLGRHL